MRASLSFAFCLSLLVLPACALSQVGGLPDAPFGAPAELARGDSAISALAAEQEGSSAAGVRTFRSPADSVEYERERGRAESARGFRVVIDLFDRQLHVVRGDDTLRVAPVAVGMRDSVISFGEQRWRFDTPRGRRTVLRKEAEPVWVPPDWHYVEVAAELGLELVQLRANRPVRLEDGRVLTVRGGRVGVVDDGEFEALPAADQIIFDGKLFIPPFGTENRRIPGELGRYRLDLGEGYLIHGTPHTDSIGDAATHGCIRLFDDDIEWLYQHVPRGTPVYIY
jgi:hypothetical protein